MDSYTIVLPLPPKPCWQNVRCHWAVKREAVKSHRGTAKLLTLAALASEQPMWESAVIDFAFYWPTKARRDPLNALGAMKAAIDGLVDAKLLVDDDKVTPGMTRMLVDKTRPRVELTVRRGQENAA